MNEYLNKPLPFIENKKHRLLTSLSFSAFIFVFLYVFQPFGMSNVVYNLPIFILGFFCITFFVLMFSFFVLPFIFKKFFDFDKWTVKKNIVFILFQVLAISVLNWLYNSSFSKDITTKYSLFVFVFMTFAVGIFPTFILVFLVEKKLSKKNQNIAKDYTQNIKPKKRTFINERVALVSKNNNESFAIDVNNFICAKSEGNYVHVYFKKDNGIIAKLIRNSISNIEEQLIIYKQIKRCHRSFLVNLDKVIKMTGNARSFNLHITDLNFTIPVSRQFPRETLKELQK